VTRGDDPDVFYRERVPAQWNRTLEDQARLAEADADARRLLDEMRRVNTTIEVVVHGDPDRRYHLNVEGGRMRADDDAARPPVVVLEHDLDTFATLERESGDSVLGFLGALAGQGGDMKLTPTRLQNLLALRGRARLELSGGAPMTLEARFGPPGEDDPACVLRLAHDTFAALRAGEVAPQEAFFGGRIEIDGDMQLALQLALAAVAPE
jgi:putative sterol carrier protein